MTINNTNCIFPVYSHDDFRVYRVDTATVSRMVCVTANEGSRDRNEAFLISLCRTIAGIEAGGEEVEAVYQMGPNGEKKLDILKSEVYLTAKKAPLPDFPGVLESNFDSGAVFRCPCMVNPNTHEIYNRQCAAGPCDDDALYSETITIDGKEHQVICIDDVFEMEELETAIELFRHVLPQDQFWYSKNGASLFDYI